MTPVKRAADEPPRTVDDVGAVVARGQRAKRAGLGAVHPHM